MVFIQTTADAYFSAHSLIPMTCTSIPASRCLMEPSIFHPGLALPVGVLFFRTSWLYYYQNITYLFGGSIALVPYSVYFIGSAQPKLMENSDNDLVSGDMLAFLPVFGEKFPYLRSESRVETIITIASPVNEVMVDRRTSHGNLVREGNVFLHPHRFSTGGLWIKQTKDRLTGKKDTQFLLIFICMGIHRKEVKLKEVVRLGGFYTILIKKRGFGLWGMLNYREVTRKCIR